MFPLANFSKTTVREIARNEGLLRVANKRDSTGMCFIGKRRFGDFIDEVCFFNFRVIYKKKNKYLKLM